MITDLDLAVQKVAELRLRAPRILILSSCTAMKRQPPAGVSPLTYEELKYGDKQRAEEVWPHRHCAEYLYLGAQHLRIMAAVRAFRATSSGYVDLRIMSAGYGVIRSDVHLPPYDVTFTLMPKHRARSWADELKIPRQVDGLLTRPDDLKIIALGADYLEAANINFSNPLFGGLTVIACSPTIAEKLPVRSNLCVVPLGRAEAKKYGCSLIALKGEVVARMLRAISLPLEQRSEAQL